MKTSRWLKTGLAGVLAAALLLTGTWTGAMFGRQLGLRGTLGMQGHLSVVHFRPTDVALLGCQDESAKLAAVKDYATHKTSTVAKVLLPPAAWASPTSAACTVLTMLLRLPNLIVDEGETALRDCFNNNSGTECDDVIKTLKFHGIGSGSTAAAESDTGCQTEWTTQYNPDSTRATGSQTTNGANIYRTVGTNTVDASATARNFCLESAATGSVVTWSHIVFAGDIALSASDALQTTYDLTID
jgi:hypothetical protein